MASLVVGAPAWNRSWCLDLYFQSVRANVDPASTGLVFVVPPDDTPTREAIARNSAGFDWVEIIRDRGQPTRRQERAATHHKTLAAARNQILKVVEQVQPEYYLSWDTDILVPAGTVRLLRGLRLPIVTPWTWLNRQPPHPHRWHDGERMHNVLSQPPVCATAMAWDRRLVQRPIHYPAEEFEMRAHGVWQAGLVLGFKLMDQRAYRVAHYAPHPDGEDVPFNQMLVQRGVSRWCSGATQGVHLYDRNADEVSLGWPGVLRLASERPLACTSTEDRPPQYVAFGLYPPPADMALVPDAPRRITPSIRQAEHGSEAAHLDDTG